MAILFLEGAEHYGPTNDADITTDAFRKWGNAQGIVTNGTSGRYSGHCLSFSNTYYSELTKDLGTLYTTLAVGCALKFRSSFSGTFPYDGPGSYVIQLLDSSGNVQLSIAVLTAGGIGTISVMRGTGSTTLLSVITGVTTAWCYFELKATIDNTAGALEIKVNGVSLGTATGIDTQATGETGVQKVRVLNGGGTAGTAISGSHYRLMYYDDVYVAEDFIANANTSTINCLTPDWEGSYNDWIPNSGIYRFNRVQDQPCDDDVTYIYAADSGNKQLFSLADIPGNPDAVNGTIHAVAVNTIVRNTGASHTLQQLLHNPSLSGTVFGGATFAPSSAYQAKQDIWQTDPNTSSPFTRTNINNMQSGIGIM